MGKTCYLDPKNIFVFNRIFDGNPDILKSFLNAFLPLEEDSLIENLEYLSHKQFPERPAGLVY